MVSVRLTAAGGDWDLAVFNAKTGRKVAGSAHFRASEIAEGFVQKDDRLVVQACRISGPAASARVSADFRTFIPSKYPIQLVRVSTPTHASKNKLTSLGLDVTEHAGRDFIDVLIHNPSQAAKLGKSGFISTMIVRDLAARDRASLRSTDGMKGLAAIASVPSGRTCPNPPARLPGQCYRTLDEYSAELTALADNYPSIVKKFTLPLASWEGRPVEGIEIATNVNARDGRPVFLMMGVHHSREWPAGEHTLEWAYELVCGFSPDPPGAPDLPCPDSSAAPSARVANLVQNTRAIIIPIMNPDGFNMSRTAGEGFGHGAGHGPVVTGDEILAYPNEYRRKNCRIHPPSLPAGSCAEPAFGVGSTGVDPNRNYGTFWGGPGSSSDPISEVFHGPHCVDETTASVKGPNCGPFSEPETENIRGLVSKRHVTTLITNHTYTGLVLRAPGLASQGLTVDEPAMKALGDAMASKNGYVSQYGWQLYDTTGTTEDWSYNTTGGYGYTFEIGKTAFHPPYAKNVAEWEGTSTDFVQNGGNREAFYLAHENTLDPLVQHHSVLTGTAPAGAILRLKKIVETPTSIRDANNAAKTFTDTLDTTMQVAASSVDSPLATYTWHINPSTRPLVAKDRGGNPTGSPSPPVALSGSLAGPPSNPPTDPGAAPCADFTNPAVTCTNTHPFTVPSGPGIDNSIVAVSLNWPSPGSDWDMKIFRDKNGDGLVNTGDTQVGSSGQSTTAFEATSFVVPKPDTDPNPGKYVVQVINYAAAEPYTGEIRFYPPEPFQPATTETWTLTCEMPEGDVKSTQQVLINRGQQLTLNIACGSPTAVQVTRFAAYNGRRGITLSWRTRDEMSIAGFNVWRANSNRLTKLNRVLIRAKATGKVSSVSYRFVDRTGRRGTPYTYRLQVVGLDGKRTWHGAAKARATR